MSYTISSTRETNDECQNIIIFTFSVFFFLLEINLSSTLYQICFYPAVFVFLFLTDELYNNI